MVSKIAGQDSFKILLDEIVKRGGDPSHIPTLLREISDNKIEVSRNDIMKFIAGNKQIGYLSTPFFLAQFMADLGRTFKPESVIDISCGLGNILNAIDYCDELTGVELNHEIASLVKFLSPGLNIIQADSLQYYYGRDYDQVISNFPYGVYKVSGQRKPIDELFVIKALEILKPNGTLICILTNKFLNAQVYQQIRMNIIANYSLEAVISLPVNIIQNSYIEPVIVLIKKAKQREKVLLTRFNEESNIINNYVNNAGNTWVDVGNLKDNWDPDYYGNERWSFLDEFESINTKRFDELADIYLGVTFHKNLLKSSGDFLLISSSNIRNNILEINKKDNYISKNDIPINNHNIIIREGDLLISRIFHKESKAYFYKSTDPPAIANSSVFIIRSANSDYLATYLNTPNGQEVLKAQIERESVGRFAPVVSISGLKKIRIPIIPTENLNQLGDNFIQRAEKEILEDFKTELKQLIADLKEQKKNSIETRELFALITNRFNAVDTQLDVIQERLDSILQILNNLNSEFAYVKSILREEEEKISRMYLLLDEKLIMLLEKDERNLDFYIKEIRLWLDCWDKLDSTSQQFLPQAEFLFDQLVKLENADYSPFIIQYCRALENEILVKLFQSYHLSLEINKIDRNVLTQDDFENSKTAKFAKYIKSDNRFYTLGDMSFIMSLMKTGGSTILKSRLLQHFKKFTLQYFSNKLYEKEFLSMIQSIVTDYRNKAAHPNLIIGEKAKEFHIVIKDCINQLLNKYIENNISDQGEN